MCLILFSFQEHSQFPLIVAANRDETYTRATAAAAFWQDNPSVYGGRDLELGGAWMGMSTTGRFAAVTNFRDGHPKGPAPRSRGELVGGFITGRENAYSYLTGVASRQSEYAGFGVLAGDLDALYFLSNYGNGVTAVTRGTHGLSNHLLDTPWPKVSEGKLELGALLTGCSAPPIEKIFDMLADGGIAVTGALPDTGVGIERERQLSAKFVAIDERYGTRASTVIVVDRDRHVTYAERSFGAYGKLLGEVICRFKITA